MDRDQGETVRIEAYHETGESQGGVATVGAMLACETPEEARLIEKSADAVLKTADTVGICLQVDIGLRGEINRAYDTNDFAAIREIAFFNGQRLGLETLAPHPLVFPVRQSSLIPKMLNWIALKTEEDLINLKDHHVNISDLMDDAGQLRDDILELNRLAYDYAVPLQWAIDGNRVEDYLAETAPQPGVVERMISPAGGAILVISGVDLARVSN